MKLKRLSLIVVIILLAITVASCGGDEEPSDEVTPATNEANQNEAENSTGSAGEDSEAAAEPLPANTPGPLSQSAQAGAFFSINEIGLGPAGFVALTNFTDVPVSLGGSYLCQGSDCFALPEVTVEGGDTVRVAAGDGEGLENVIATEATFGELRSADGEMALFASEDTEDPAALLVYLQWGSTPHDLTSMAVDRGLWFETSYAPSGADATRLYRVEESGLWLWE